MASRAPPYTNSNLSYLKKYYIFLRTIFLTTGLLISVDLGNQNIHLPFTCVA